MFKEFFTYFLSTFVQYFIVKTIILLKCGNGNIYFYNEPILFKMSGILIQSHLKINSEEMIQKNLTNSRVMMPSCKDAHHKRILSFSP